MRKRELEGFDSNLIIIDLLGSSKCKIINVYRKFSPQNGVSQRVKFNLQLDLINSALSPESILVGDFNLDLAKRLNTNYSLKNYFIDMDSKLSDHHLAQLVDFPTWSRTLNGVIKESKIDYMYVSNPYQISNLDHTSIIFTDHEIIKEIIKIMQSEQRAN